MIGLNRAGGEPGFDIVNLLLQCPWSGRNSLCFLKKPYCALQIPLAFFQARKIHRDFFQQKCVGIFVRCLLLPPTALAKLPNIASASEIVVILGIKSPKREEDLGAVRIGTKSFAQKLLGLIDFSQSVAQPISCDRVGLDMLRIEFSRKTQPGKNLAFLALPKMAVLSNSKITSEFLQAISWRPKKSRLVLIAMAVVLFTSFQMGRIRLGGRMIENGGIIATVEIDVGFDEEMIRKHAAPI